MKLLTILLHRPLREDTTPQSDPFELPTHSTKKLDITEANLTLLLRRARHAGHQVYVWSNQCNDLTDRLVTEFPNDGAKYYPPTDIGWSELWPGIPSSVRGISQIWIRNNPPPAVVALSAAILKCQKRLHVATTQFDDLETRSSAMNRKLAAEHVEAQKKLTPRVTIAPANIPTRISTGGKGWLDNPAAAGYGYTDSYAGTPEHYTWSTPMLTMYKTLNGILLQRGLGKFNVVYGGRHSGKYINFITLAAGGAVVWRKYDAGGGSGQNHVYIDGVKYQSSTLMTADEAELDKMFAPLMKKTP